MRPPPLAVVTLVAWASGCAASAAPPPATPLVDTPAPAASPATDDRAAATRLLELAIEAKGGRARLTALRSLHATGTIRLVSADFQVVGEFERWLVVPDRQRVDVTVNGKTISVIIAGDEAVQRTDAQLRPVEGVAADQLVASLWRDRDLVLRNALAPDASVSDAGTEVVADTTCDAFTVRRAGEPRVRVLLDPATHAIVRLVPLGDDARGHEDAADYQAIDGLQVARRITSVGAGPSTELTLATVELDLPIAADVFALAP